MSAIKLFLEIIGWGGILNVFYVVLDATGAGVTASILVWAVTVDNCVHVCVSAFVEVLQKDGSVCVACGG